MPWIPCRRFRLSSGARIERDHRAQYGLSQKACLGGGEEGEQNARILRESRRFSAYAPESKAEREYLVLRAYPTRYRLYIFGYMRLIGFIRARPA